MALIYLVQCEHDETQRVGRIVLTHLNAFPLFIPIPSFDSHVITSCEHDTRGGVNCKASYIVRVGLKCDNLLVGVVIEDAQLEVVRASNEPVFSGNELDTAHRNGGDLKCLDKCASFVVVDVDGTVV